MKYRVLVESGAVLGRHVMVRAFGLLEPLIHLNVSDMFKYLCKFCKPHERTSTTFYKVIRYIEVTCNPYLYTATS